MRLQNIDPSEHRTLVVGRAATDEFAVLLGQDKRLGVPSVTLQRLVNDVILA